MVCCLFCFFKQKTAYEMRISDWSSDVCSSDLTPFKQWQGAAKIAPQRQLVGGPGFRSAPLGRKRQGGGEITQHSPGLPLGRALKTQLALLRSEEHTSELQSLMRISYAVFCLKKKKTLPTQNITTTQQYKTNYKS